MQQQNAQTSKLLHEARDNFFVCLKQTHSYIGVSFKTIYSELQGTRLEKLSNIRWTTLKCPHMLTPITVMR